MKIPVVSLRILLPGLVTVCALALLSAMCWQSLRSARSQVIAQTTSEVWATGAELQKDLDRFNRRGDLEGTAGSVRWTSVHALAEGAVLIGSDGKVLAASRAEWVGRPSVSTLPAAFLPSQDQAQAHVESVPGSDIIVGFFPIDFDGQGQAQVRGVLVLALNAGRPVAVARADAWGQIRILALGALALALLLGLTLDYLVSRRVGALQETVARIATGDYSARPNVRGGDELGTLARGLELMTDRLAATSTERDRASRLLQVQNEVLAAIAESRPLVSVFDQLCAQVELTHERSQCSVMELTASGLHVVAGPSIGPDARAMFDGLIPGPQAGSFGTAAHTRSAVFVCDTQTDPRWGGMREVAETLGIRACWSVPITDGDTVYGTFAISHPVPREPDDRDREILATSARLAGIAVRRTRSQQALRDSEERLRLLTETIDEVFWMSTPQIDRMLYVSPAYERIWGRTPESLYSDPRSFLNAIHPEDRNGLLAVLEPRNGHAFRAEYRVVRPDGTLCWVEDRGFPVREPDGRLRAMVGCVRDITERKHAEQTLIAREARFRSVVETSPDGFWMVDAQGRISEVNEAYARRSGYTRAELLGLGIGDVEAKEDQAEIESHIVAIRRNGYDRYESRHRAKDGTTWPVKVTAAYSPETGGSFAFLQDITERKRAEDRVRRATELLQAVADGTPDAIFVKDREGKYLLFNEAAAGFVGKTVADVLDRDDTQLFEPDSAREVMRLDRQVMESGAPVMAEETLTAAGVTRTYLARKSPYRDATGAVVGVIGVSTDITEKMRMELALRESESRLRLALEAASAIAFVWDAQTDSVTRYYSTEPALPENVGRPESVADVVARIYPDDRAVFDAAVSACLARGSEYRNVYRVRRADESVVWLEEWGTLDRDPAGRPLRLTGVSIDVTERKQAERTLKIMQFSVENFADAVFWVGPDARILYVNRAASNRFRTSPNERDPWYLFDFDPDMSALDWPVHWTALKERGSLVFERQHRLTDGRLISVEINANYVNFEGSEFNFASAHDITNRKRAEQSLRESEERFRTVVESVPTGLLAVDADGRIVLVNQRAVEWFGYDRAELVGRSVEDLVPPRFQHTHPTDRRRYTANPVPRPMGSNRDLYGVRKDGTEFPVEIGLVPMASATGPLVLAAIADITERKQASAALRESEVRYRTVVDRAMDPLFVHDLTGRFVEINQTACEAFGYTRDEFLGLSIPDIDQDFSPAGVAEMIASFAAAPGQMMTFETRHRRKDGTVFPVEMRVGAVQLGDTLRIVGLAHDLTQRKHAEAEIRALNADLERRVNERTAELSRLVTILEASPDLIAIFDMSSKRAIYTNGAFRRLAVSRGIAPENLVIGLIHSPESARRVSEEGLPAAARDGIWLGETEVLGPGDRSIPVSELIQLHKGPDGQIQYISKIMRDISDRKRMEDELRHRRDALLLANTDLAKASRLKDEFLASMSHELRTPLNGVLAMSEALQEEVYGPVNPQQVAALRDIEQCGRHLLALINDILDLSKIEAGEITLEMGDVDVNGLCQAALRFVKEMAQKKRHRVSLSIDGTTGTIVADERRLKQILVNLLSNAVKFTPDGGALALEVRGDEARAAISFTVTDTGIGIREEDLGLLFRPFQQIDSRLSREYAGTGLGLALVRRMAELHGGSVTVESTPGKGSRFTVNLPWNPAETVTEPEPADARPSRVRKVLLVEDSPGDIEKLERYLADLNVEAVVHPGATGALERIRTEHPDLILLDLLLPDGDGWAILTALKADPELHAIPVIVISVVDDRTRCLALGAAAHLVKPLDREMLRSALRQAVRVVEGSRAVVVLPELPGPSAPLLLLAEDNPINARSVRDFLQSVGYRVMVVPNGFLALQRANDSRPALILMDIQLPGIDGLEVIRRIRVHETTHHIPIVAVTALAMPGDRERCLAAGADDYLMKPLSLRQLLILVGRHVPLSGTPDAS